VLDRKPRVKSVRGAGSPRFIGVRATGQAAHAYLAELGRTTANCNQTATLAAARYCDKPGLGPAAQRFESV